MIPLLHLRGGVREIVLDVRCAGERRLPVLFSALGTRDDGRLALVRITVVDGTDRISRRAGLAQTRRSVQESEQRLRVLHRAAGSFAGAATTAEVATCLRRVLLDDLRVADALLWLADADARALTLDGLTSRESVLVEGRKLS